MTTQKENELLKAITENDFQSISNSFEDCIDNPVYMWVIEEESDLSSKTISGVVSSLKKKGLIKSNNEVISLTEKGYNLLVK